MLYRMGYWASLLCDTHHKYGADYVMQIHHNYNSWVSLKLHEKSIIGPFNHNLYEKELKLLFY